MGKPLFTTKEIEEFKERLTKHENEGGRTRTKDWETYWGEHEALKKAYLIETGNRVRIRTEEFLDALIILVGSKGTFFVEFENAFLWSGTEELGVSIKKYDTPEARRALYTLLRALTEVPKSWGRSALERFLRGTGKQKGALYHGASMFSTDYGWRGDEVNMFCRVLVDEDSPYAKVFTTHIDAVGEIKDADPDFEVIDHDATFKATRIERDKIFLQTLCDMLEAKGLANVAIPKEKGPKKERLPKVFKSGDVIKYRDLRDLPLPAHVRILIEKEDEDTKQWIPSTLEYVVTRLSTDGYFYYLLVGKDKKAYEPDWYYKGKEWLEGATYLGAWQGETVKNKELKLKFRYRKPN